MKSRWTAVLVLALALAAALGAAEVTLRLLSKHWLLVYDVEMWRYAKSIKVISRKPGVVEEQIPRGDAWLMGARVRTDANGFRLPDPATLAARRPDGRQVVAVGDSLTFGWGVPEGMTYADQLARLLDDRCPKEHGRRVTVHNAGIGNCNTSMEYQRYRQCIRPRLKPDWVVLGYVYNDAEPDPVPDTNPVFWHSALASLTWARLARVKKPLLLDYKNYYQGLYVDGRPGWERCKQALRDFGELLRRDGIPHTLLLLPELHEPRHFGPLAGIYGPVRRIAEAAGFEVVDASTGFPPGSGERYFVTPEDAHPNAAAQTLFAQALATSRYACD
ncbi:MAG TPA: GDSL-type esterase/lipase family protein [Thermoanaerobaculia bacterium]|jgi:lysophospholipase L1-like esterase|nr:GDSL-type esterase/lipase family protein [Thermoanaerobaculia bacterium]